MVNFMLFRDLKYYVLWQCIPRLTREFFVSYYVTQCFLWNLCLTFELKPNTLPRDCREWHLARLLQFRQLIIYVYTQTGRFVYLVRLEWLKVWLYIYLIVRKSMKKKILNNIWPHRLFFLKVILVVMNLKLKTNKWKWDMKEEIEG